MAKRAEHEPVDLEQVLDTVEALRPTRRNYRLDLAWQIGQNVYYPGEIYLSAGLRIDRRAGRVEDFTAEDEGVGVRDRRVSWTPYIRWTLSASSPQGNRLRRSPSGHGQDDKSTKPVSYETFDASTEIVMSQAASYLGDERALADERFSREKLAGQVSVRRPIYRDESHVETCLGNRASGHPRESGVADDSYLANACVVQRLQLTSYEGQVGDWSERTSERSKWPHPPVVFVGRQDHRAPRSHTGETNGMTTR
jgi:hypothetical protein